MDRNLRLYPWYQAARHGLFWAPVFFLYFTSQVSLDDALLLEAIYYAGVVLLEVPSGYLADRVGRRPTLVVAMAMWAAACALFATGSGFAAFAVAQLLMATGMAFNSGSDSALLFDSLAAVGREAEIGAEEGRAQSYAFAALAVSAVGGGLLGGWSLRLAYAASAVAGAIALGVALALREPPRHGEAAQPPLAQLVAVARRLREPGLGWLFAVAVAMTVLHHVPYELFQPWLDQLLARHARPDYAVAPAAAGGLLGATMIVSAWVSRRADRLGRRLGVPTTLLLCLAAEVVVAGAMGLVVHAALIPLLLCRTVPDAVLRPVLRSAVHPRIGSGQRATYLSVQSLAGRLAFSLSLAVASAAVGDGARATAESLRTLLLGFAAAGAAVVAALALRRLRA